MKKLKLKLEIPIGHFQNSIQSLINKKSKLQKELTFKHYTITKVIFEKK